MLRSTAMGEARRAQFQSIDQWFNDAWSRVEADAYRLAQRCQLDWGSYGERIYRVLEETAWTDTLRHQNQPLVEVEAHDIDTTVPADIHYFPSFEDALLYLPAIEALELFESSDRPDLMHCQWITEEVVKAAHLFHTPTELHLLTGEAITYLEHHRETLLATGYGPKSQQLPQWITAAVKTLYPVRVTSSLDAESIPGLDKIAVRVQAMRSFALDSKLRMFRLLDPAVTGHSSPPTVQDLVGIWSELLGPKDIAFLLQSDHLYDQLGVAAGGVFAQICIFRQYIEEFAFAAHARVRQILESAGLMDLSNPLSPRLRVESYFQVRDPRQRQALNEVISIFQNSDYSPESTGFHLAFQADLHRELRAIGLGLDVQQLIDPIALVRSWSSPSSRTARAPVDASSSPHSGIGAENSRFMHTEDYSSVSLDGIPYNLTPDEAKCIRILHQAYLTKLPCVPKKVIMDQVKGPNRSPDSRWRDLWGPHRETCKALIADCSDAKNRVRLNID